MNFLVERDVLKDALSVVIGQTKARLNIPILTHVLIEASGQSIKLTGHNLDSCSQVSAPAEISAEGSIAIPGEYFAKLIVGFSEGSTVLVNATKEIAKVKSGRSLYQLPLLPPSEFPLPLEPKEPVTLTLTPKQVARLFKSPECSISDEQSRIYLNGIYLHKDNKRLAACATNGHTLVRVFSDAKAPDFDGVIIPQKSCHEIARLADADTTFEITSTLLAIAVGSRRFVTKLIDGTFPDYNRVIPQSATPAIAVMAKDIDAALARLDAACDREERSPAVKLSWSGDVESLSASLRSKVGSGEEQIECDCPGRNPGEVGAQIDYVRNIVAAMGGDRVRILVDDPGSPIKFENPDDPDVVGVVMPCRV